MLGIRYESPINFKLIADFKDDGQCKLYCKDDIYVCSFVVDFFGPTEILYIEIEITKEQLEKTRQPPFHTIEEIAIFGDKLLSICKNIDDETYKENTYLTGMEIEEFGMLFWANAAIDYIGNNAYTEDISLILLLYSLSQCIYNTYNTIEKEVKENLVKENLEV